MLSSLGNVKISLWINHPRCAFVSIFMPKKKNRKQDKEYCNFLKQVLCCKMQHTTACKVHNSASSRGFFSLESFHMIWTSFYDSGRQKDSVEALVTPSLVLSVTIWNIKHIAMALEEEVVNYWKKFPGFLHNCYCFKTL